MTVCNGLMATNGCDATAYMAIARVYSRYVMADKERWLPNRHLFSIVLCCAWNVEK